MRDLLHRRDDADDLARTSTDDALQLREAADGPREVEGYAIRWGDLTRSGAAREYPGARETFVRGAFAEVIAARAGRPIPLVDQHNGTVVGAVTLTEDATGLHYRGQLLGSQDARDFAERAALGVIQPSIEFRPGVIRRVGDIVQHVRVSLIAAIAGAYAPAYTGTTIQVREDAGRTVNVECSICHQPITDGVAHVCAGAPAVTPPAPTADTIVAGPVTMSREAVRDLIDTSVRTLLERGGLRGGDAGLGAFEPFAGHASLGHLFAAAAQEDADPALRTYAANALAHRALADQLTTDSNAGVTTAGIMQDVHGLVSRGRPAINAFGGPRPILQDVGMSVDWPYYDGTLSSLVGAQSAEKAEITSAKVQIKKGTEALVTYAGGSDISYQLIRRSSPAYLEVYARVMLLAYAVVTDAAFVTELETGSVTSDFAEALSAVDATEFKNLVIDASIAVQTATGIPAEFILAGPAAFAQFAKLFTPITTAPTLLPSGSTGITDLRSLTVNVGGLPIIYVPSLTTGKLIVSNREAAAWYEEGPFQAVDEDVAKLGRNVAYWGMGAGARFIPAGIIEMYDVTP